MFILIKKILFVPLISYQALGLDDFQEKEGFVTHACANCACIVRPEKDFYVLCAIKNGDLLTSELDWLQFCFVMVQNGPTLYTWRNCSWRDNILEVSFKSLEKL
jgi:hypothetical protein